MYSTCIDTVDKGKKIRRRRKHVTGPKILYQGTETDRRYELPLPICCQCDSTLAVATVNTGYFIARVHVINMPASFTLIRIQSPQSDTRKTKVFLEIYCEERFNVGIYKLKICRN
jgi:hypothetical protein